jgi:hypothetical protein
MAKKRNTYGVLVGEAEGKRLIEDRRRWEDDIKMNERMWTGFT